MKSNIVNNPANQVKELEKKCLRDKDAITTGNYVPFSLCCDIGKNIIEKRRAVRQRANQILLQRAMEVFP